MKKITDDDGKVYILVPEEMYNETPERAMTTAKTIKTYNETISFTSEGRELSRYAIEGELLREGNGMYRLLIKCGGVIPKVKEWEFDATSDTAALQKATYFINA